MDIHKKARTTPYCRAELVRRVASGATTGAVAGAFGVCQKTVRKWVARFEREGAAGLRDRRSRPHRLPGPTAAVLAEQALVLRPQPLLLTRLRHALHFSLPTAPPFLLL